jgi:hypothetical protein
MTTIEESVKTEVISAIRRMKPKIYRIQAERMTKERMLTFVEEQMIDGIATALSDRIEGVSQLIDGNHIGHYNFTEAERTELMEAWNDWGEDDEPPLSDYQLVKHYEDYILDRFFEEWFEYYKIYRDSDLQA